MADIIRSTSIPDTGANRQDFYDALNLAQLSNIALTDLTAETVLGTIRSGSLPPSGMTHGQLWWDNTWEVLRQFDTTTSLSCAIGPDMFQMPARAACPIMKDHAVLIDMAETWTLEGGTPGLNTIPAVRCCTDGMTFCEAIGMADDTVASGAYLAVNVRGFMTAWILGGDTCDIRDFVVGQSGFSGACVGKSYQDTDLAEGKEVYLGVAVERFSSVQETRGSQSTFFKWYGPRRIMEQ